MPEWWLMHWGPSWLPADVRVVWGWKAAIALFFAGSGAMTMFFAAQEDWRGQSQALVRAGLISGMVGLAVALGPFVWDLGKPLRFYLSMTSGWTSRLGSSWMPWGALFIVLLLALGLYDLALARGRATRRVIAVPIMVLALLATVYSGFEFHATNIALWNGYLPLLFLTMSWAVGAAFLMILARYVAAEGQERALAVRRLGQTTLVGVLAEGVVLGLFLWTGAEDTRAAAAVRFLLSGSLSVFFWVSLALVAVAVALLSRVSAAAAALCPNGTSPYPMPRAPWPPPLCADGVAARALCPTGTARAAASRSISTSSSSATRSGKASGTTPTGSWGGCSRRSATRSPPSSTCWPPTSGCTWGPVTWR